ncbi:MAG: hypothetical protein ACE5QV_08110 [Fidelibacterota bacterium]
MAAPTKLSGLVGLITIGVSTWGRVLGKTQVWAERNSKNKPIKIIKNIPLFILFSSFVKVIV